MAGIFATALNIMGNGNTVKALPQALLSVAFGLLSNNVTVEAGPGPLSFAGEILANGMAVGQAIRSAMDVASSPLNGATYAAARTLGDAMAAASAGDAGAVLTTLAHLPGSVLDAFLFGYDVDGAGPAAPVAGLLSAKDPNCTTQCHDGGPLYQFFVGIPKAVAAAIANIHAAAESSDDPAAAVSATEGTDSSSAATELVSSRSPDQEDDAVTPAAGSADSAGTSEESSSLDTVTVGEEPEDGDATDESGPAVTEIDDGADSPDAPSDEDIADEDAPESTDSPETTAADTENATDGSDAGSGDSSSESATEANSTGGGKHRAPDDSDDGSSSSATGASSDEGGKHRAGRHAA